MSSNRKDARWGIAFYVVEDICGMDWNELPYATVSNLLLAIDSVLLRLPESKHREIAEEYFENRGE